jgi:hypothetical protein
MHRFRGTRLTVASRPLDPPRVTPNAATRAVAAGVFALTVLVAIGWVSWRQDLRYSLPTPRPANWHRPVTGAAVTLPASLAALRAVHPGQPLFLHFFNPDCPCSRFNVDHVRDLEARFGRQVVFVAVLAEGDATAMRRAYRSLPLDLPSYVDADHQLADALGVYSTPQAAIVDSHDRLVYQGNYNVTRYCRDRQTEFARLALESIVAGLPPPQVPPAATTAYGCPLPPRPISRAAL